jgi:hypothetical protein
MEQPTHLEQMAHQLAAYATTSFDRHGRGVIVAVCEWERVVSVDYVRDEDLGEMLVSTPDLLLSTRCAAGAYDPGRQFVLAAINARGAGRGCWTMPLSKTRLKMPNRRQPN